MNVEMARIPELPKGWVGTVLGEIGRVNLGKTPRKTQYTSGGGLKIVKFRDIVGDSICWDKNDKGFVVSSESVIAQLSELHKGDVLVTASAHSSEHIGKKVVYVSTIPQRYSKVFFVGELLCVRVNEDGINPRIVYYYLSSQDGYRAIQDHVRGVHLIASEARQIPISLPPLSEQHRIVAKIEELFTRLDAGVEALKKIKAQLKRYRQAVLKHAFEGKLTAEWSQAHQHELEPASALLERIRQERHKIAKGKYKELPPLDTSALPELPEGWVWARIGDICETTSGGTPSRRKAIYYGGAIPWLKSGELKDDVIRSVEEFITEEGLKNSSAKIIPKGSLLMALYGATVGKLGVLAIDTAINQAICAIFAPIHLDKTLLFWYLIKFRYELLAARRGGAQPNISMGIVNNIVLPLPPSSEQKEIASEIERRLSVADQIEKTVDQGLKQAERLRQSILKRAFEGKLVPQNPNDEPAEKLLERIKAEKTKQMAEKRVTVSRVKRRQSTEGH